MKRYKIEYAHGNHNDGDLSMTFDGLDLPGALAYIRHLAVPLNMTDFRILNVYVETDDETAWDLVPNWAETGANHMTGITEQELAEKFHMFMAGPRAKELAEALFRPGTQHIPNKPANYDQMTTAQQHVYDTLYGRDKNVLLYTDMTVAPWLRTFTPTIGRKDGHSEILMLTTDDENRPYAETAVVVCALRKAFPDADMGWICGILSDHPIYKQFLAKTLTLLPWLLNEEVQIMSNLAKKQIDRLYTLMEKEKDDPDMMATLRWAIFNLELQQQPPESLPPIIQYAAKPEAEINGIIDTGVFNEIIKGYVTVAMREAGQDDDKILDAVNALDAAFDTTDADAARKAYREL